MCIHDLNLCDFYRLSQVTREGKYVQSDVPRQLLYSTMVYVRQTIVADASRALSRAVCIATRYSAVRKQFGSQDGGPESAVLCYSYKKSIAYFVLYNGLFSYSYYCNCWVNSMLFSSVKVKWQINSVNLQNRQHRLLLQIQNNMYPYKNKECLISTHLPIPLCFLQIPKLPLFLFKYWRREVEGFF